MVSRVRATSLAGAAPAPNVKTKVRDVVEGRLLLRGWLLLEPAARIASVSRRRDPLVLPVREPRVPRDIPQVREVALEPALTPQNFVDRPRTAIHASALVHRVQFLEQVLQLQLGK